MRSRRMSWVRVVALICLTLLVALSCLGSVAWADEEARSVSYGPVRIEGCVTSDGALHVRERRHVTYTGTYHGLFWLLRPSYGYDFSDLEDGRLVVVGAGEYADGAYVPYELAEAPDDPAEASVGTYTITSQGAINHQLPRVDVHFERTDEQAEFYVEYEARDFCDRWQDVGKLEWDFVGDNWDADATDVFLDLYVERSEDSGVWEDENVFWWVQTYAQVGEVTLEDGKLPDWAAPEAVGRTLPAAHLAARIDTLKAGRDAEVVVMFPQDWLGAMRQVQIRKRDEVMERETKDAAYYEHHKDDEDDPSAGAGIPIAIGTGVFCVVAISVLAGKMSASGMGGGGGSTRYRSGEGRSSGGGSGTRSSGGGGGRSSGGGGGGSY